MNTIGKKVLELLSRPFECAFCGPIPIPDVVLGIFANPSFEESLKIFLLQRFKFDHGLSMAKLYQTKTGKIFFAWRSML
jgi:hypothetical protein